MKQIKEREKMPALRISDDSVNHVRSKYAEGSAEREVFENVLLARIPYALISHLTGIPHADVRDMVTGRKLYTPDAKEKICDQVNQLIERGLDLGLYPCADLAVIQPATDLLLSYMVSENKLARAVAALRKLSTQQAAETAA